MKKWLMILACLFVVSASGCAKQEDKKKAEQPQIPVIEFDYEKVTGITEAVTAQYDYAEAFNEGVALVGKYNESNEMIYNFIKPDGSLLSDNWFDYAMSFSEGYAVVGKRYENGPLDNEGYRTMRFGYLDIEGNMAIEYQYIGEPNYYHPLSFYQGRAEVTIYEENQTGGWGGVLDKLNVNVVNTSGVKQLSLDELPDYGMGGYPDSYDPRVLNLTYQQNKSEFARLSSYQNQQVYGYHAPTIISNKLQNKSIVLADDGEQLFAMDAGALYTNEYNQNYIMVTRIGETDYFGLVDATGKIMIAPDAYTQLWYIDAERLLAMDENGNYGIINENKEVLIPLEWAQIYTDNGQIIVGDNDDTGMRYFLLNTDGTVKADLKEAGSVYLPCYYQYSGETMTPVYSSYIVTVTYEESKNISRLYDYEGELLLETEGTISYLDDYLLVNYRDANPRTEFRQNGYLLLTVTGIGNVVDKINDRYFYSVRVDDTTYSSHYTLLSFTQDDMVLRYTIVAESNSYEELEQIANRPEGTAETVLAQNAVSSILDNADQSGTVSLVDKEGNIISAYGEHPAVSLISDGFYLFADELVNDYENYYYEKKPSGYGIANVNHDVVSDSYDWLGTLHEGMLVFKQNGKYGYLRLTIE